MKKVVIGLSLLVAVCGLAMAHINYKVCDTPGCSEVIGTERVNVKQGTKYCNKCSATGTPTSSGKCTKHQNYCEILEGNANGGDERAKGLWYDNCKPTN